MKKVTKIMTLFLAVMLVAGVFAPVEAEAASYKLSVSGYSRKPGDSTGGITSKWKVKEMSRKSSCISSAGEDVVYFRSGLIVKATSMKKGGTENITEIRISKKNYKTQGGIRVGTSYDRLKKKFKNLKKLGFIGTNYYVKKGGVRITYYIKSGKVSLIVYNKG